MAEISMREAYGKALAAYGERDPNVVVLDADTSASTLSNIFAKRFPERFFNIGIAEPCMVDVAAGLALGGMIPFANAFASLFSLRAQEQVRSSVCYANTNVKLAASYAGLSDFKDGATHYSITDLAIMRAMPGMTVIAPADADQAAAWVPLIAQHDGPVYLRISRADAPPIFQDGTNLQIGKALILRPGDDLTIISTGAMAGRCLQAVEALAAEGIEARLVEMHTLKPLDREAVLKAAAETGGIVTAEEHSVIGGLGSAVAEVLAEEHPAPLARVGIQDHFCPTARSLDGLMDACGLSVDAILFAGKQILERGNKR